jgi:hypothetical protein
MDLSGMDEEMRVYQDIARDEILQPLNNITELELGDSLRDGGCGGDNNN